MPRVLRADGSAFHANGVAVWVAPDSVLNTVDSGIYPETFSTAQDNAMDTIIASHIAWGVNVARFRIQADSYNHMTTPQKAAYIALIKRWHDAYNAKGIIFKPCLWDGLDGIYSGAAFGAAGGSGYLQLYQLITDVYNAIGDPWMPWEPANEPHGISNADWLTAMKGLFATLRGLGCKAVLTADPNAWANSGTSSGGLDLTGWRALKTYDAGLCVGLGLSEAQMAVAKHDYANGASSLNTSAWMTSVGNVTDLVIWETEIGNYNGPGTANSAWNTSAVSFLGNLQSTMPNFVGSDAFVSAWIDANTMTETSGNTVRTDNHTLSAWGAQALGLYR